MVGEAVSWFVPWNQSVYQKVREVGEGKLCVTFTVPGGMESVIFETIRKVVTELPREDAEVKAGQLSKDLTERGLLTTQELKFVTKEHLLQIFNEFQTLRILHEWNKPQTDTAARSSGLGPDDVDVRWETIWELDQLAKEDPGELKTALNVEKRWPSRSAELLLINYLVGKAKAKLLSLPKENDDNSRRSERDVMEPYVLHCVRMFPFHDQCGSSNIGYRRFMKHAKDQFDNRRRLKEKKGKETYG